MRKIDQQLALPVLGGRHTENTLDLWMASIMALHVMNGPNIAHGAGVFTVYGSLRGKRVCTFTLFCMTLDYRLKIIPLNTSFGQKIFTQSCSRWWRSVPSVSWCSGWVNIPVNWKSYTAKRLYIPYSIYFLNGVFLFVSLTPPTPQKGSVFSEWHHLLHTLQYIPSTVRSSVFQFVSPKRFLKIN